MATPQDHPQRYALNNELHARPFVDIVAPQRISHFAILVDERRGTADKDHLLALCERYDAARPAADATHYTGDFGTFRLKWERHTEFTTYTFFRAGRFDDPFEECAADIVPESLLAELPGTRIVAVHLALAPQGQIDADAFDFSNHFVVDSLCRGSMLGGSADVATDFRIHSDGYSRILVQDRGLLPRQAGQLVQRLLEVQTYRDMALLALPMARAAGPIVRRVDEALAQLTAHMKNPGNNADALVTTGGGSTRERSNGPRAKERGSDAVEDETALLDELMTLSAEIEESIANTSYRFSAANAYTTLVHERMDELGEVAIQGYPTLTAFIERRFAPAMRTCVSVATRQASLSQRATRAGNLLRTRVDIKLEAQNRDLLASMNRRARLQLRLQQTVEGLSIAAITYYLASLVGYLLDAAKDGGADLPTGLLKGISVVIIAATVWLIGRKVRERLRREEGD